MTTSNLLKTFTDASPREQVKLISELFDNQEFVSTLPLETKLVLETNKLILSLENSKDNDYENFKEDQTKEIKPYGNYIGNLR